MDKSGGVCILFTDERRNKKQEKVTRKKVWSSNFFNLQHCQKLIETRRNGPPLTPPPNKKERNFVPAVLTHLWLL